MAVTATPVFVQTPIVTPQSFVQGTDAAGTYKTCYTAGANGSKIVALVASTTDGTTGHLITVAITRSATNYVVCNVNCPLNAGNDGTVAAVDLLNATINPGLPVDNDGQKYIILKSGDTLSVTFATALTAGKTIYVTAIGADF
jgi:beta-xylosidase